MGNKLNFTQANLAAIAPAAPGKRDYYNDTRVPGLQLQVTETGVKTFYVYRRVLNRPTRIKLGRFPDMAVAKARDQAKITLGKIASGENPAAARTKEVAERLTLLDAFDEYIKVRTLKDKTAYDYRRVIEVAFGDWKTKRLARITKDMVGTRHQGLGKDRGEAYANLAMRVLNAIYTFARGRYEDDSGESLLPSNPVQRLSATRAWYRQRRREGRIEPNELKPWFGAVLALKNEERNPMAATAADYLLLLIFTGLRRTEGARLTWDAVNLENRTLTIHDTKNHENHRLPLPDYLHAILAARKAVADQAADGGAEAGAGRAPVGANGGADGDAPPPNPYVFPGKEPGAPLIEPRSYVDKVVKASGIGFTLHDLRRTFVTVADSLDIPAYAVKRLVNHKMRGDVTAGYIVSDVDRLRGPMQQICDYLLKASGIKETKIIPIKLREPTHG